MFNIAFVLLMLVGAYALTGEEYEQFNKNKLKKGIAYTLFIVALGFTIYSLYDRIQGQIVFKKKNLMAIPLAILIDCPVLVVARMKQKNKGGKRRNKNGNK